MPCCPPKSKFLCITAGLLVLLLVAGAGFLLGQKLSQPKTSPIAQVTPIPTPTIDQTVYTEDTRSANWKTYADSKFPITFKYPGDAKVNLIAGMSNENNVLLDVSPKKESQFLIQIQNNPAGGQYLIVVNSSEKREIAGKQWVVSKIPIRTVDFGYPLQGNGPFLIYQFVDQNISYAIIFKGETTDNIQNQILSTFQFLD